MTQDQIKNMTDVEIDRAVAEVLGLEIAEEMTAGTGLVWVLDSGHHRQYIYHPTSDTEAGRSQCFQLMVEFRLSPSQLICDVWAVELPGAKGGNTAAGIQRAICEAVLMSQVKE